MKNKYKVFFSFLLIAIIVLMQVSVVFAEEVVLIQKVISLEEYNKNRNDYNSYKPILNNNIPIGESAITSYNRLQKTVLKEDSDLYKIFKDLNNVTRLASSYPNEWGTMIVSYFNLYTKGPMVYKDNCLYKSGNYAYVKLENGKEDFNWGKGTVGNLELWAKTLVVVYTTPGSNIVDVDGKVIEDFKAPYSGEAYRPQKKLEQYSKYEKENYPFAPIIPKSIFWLNDSSKIKDRNSDYWKNYNIKSNYAGDCPFPFEWDYFYYNFYVYKPNLHKWVRCTYYTYKPIIFEPATGIGGTYKPPKLSFPKGGSSLMIEYGADDKSATIIGRNPLDAFYASNVEIGFIERGPYIVNDDLMDNKSVKNKGTYTNDGKDVITDPDGKPYNPDDPKPYEKPNERPGKDGGIIDWIVYIFDSIGKFFSTLIDGIVSLSSQCASVFSLIGSMFTFLPAPIWTIISCAIVVVIILRIFGR